MAAPTMAPTLNPVTLLAKQADGTLTPIVVNSNGQLALDAVAFPAIPLLTGRLLSAAASTNATSVKASAATLYSIKGYNARGSAVYLKIYNKASAPTVGSDTPVMTIYLPASSAFALDWTAGYALSLGLAYALTTAGADADTGALTAADILALNVDYS